MGELKRGFHPLLIEKSRESYHPFIISPPLLKKERGIKGERF
jgi:hypothetical protein